MIDHIGLAVSDIARSRAFYEQALAPLGMKVLAVIPRDQTETAARRSAMRPSDHVLWRIAEK